jgi:hypothetical protein
LNCRKNEVQRAAGKAYDEGMAHAPRTSRLPLACAGLLLAAHVVVPLVGGDVYPFTSAPMFRDRPHACCQYRVILSDGSEAPAHDWQLQRVYDGNPVGYGVGTRPPEVLEQQFGDIHDEAAVRQHVARQWTRAECREIAAVEVIQERIGATAGGQVGVVESRRWRITRPDGIGTR